MQHKPAQIEITRMSGMAQEERLHYFLTRAVEAEEIWSLGNESGWELHQNGDRRQILLWPYLELARLNIASMCSSSSPQATSLDHFFQSVLPVMIAQHIDIEVNRMPGVAGKHITASELYAILESMLDSGEYYIEA